MKALARMSDAAGGADSFAIDLMVINIAWGA
jgi:hypothetical protein